LISKTSSKKTAELRRRIAREAAVLLYFGLEKEYKQAKLKAAESLSAHVLPSNLEVAIELDQIAEETEGPARGERLVQMRTDALKVMKALRVYCPVLLGSVWRGTIRKGSDIDIEAFSDEPESLVNVLNAGVVNVLKTQYVTTTEHGKAIVSFHVTAESTNGHQLEIVVRPSEETGKKRTCDTFGDEIKGLNVRDLERLLKEHPSNRFLPC